MTKYTDQTRHFSPTPYTNQKKKNDNPFADLYGLPFSVSPEQALDQFEQWARKEQGLNSFLMSSKNIRVTAAYTPVWSFTLNVRFVLITDDTAKSGRRIRRLDWKPDVFEVAYGRKQSVVHLPGLAAYAGHSYRRSLLDPLHNSTLLFMGPEVVPFGAWMMRNMELKGETLIVSPDPWNTTKGRALGVVKEHLENLCNSANNLPSEEHVVKIQTEVLSARRVYMPTYVIDYKVFPNMEFQAFVSGCDSAAGVSSISHKVFDDTSAFYTPNDFEKARDAIFSTATSVAHTGYRLGLRNREIGTIFMLLFQFAGSLATRILPRIPIIGFLGGLFVGFRKLIRPWMDSRSATAEWERQREYEASNHFDDHADDFVDTGAAQRYFEANREIILRHLSGDAQHTRGNYDWYQEWEKWARDQWARQQQQQQQQQQSYSSHEQQQYQQSYQQQRNARQQKKTDFQWDFDPSDPYSVLGIKRGASKQEVSTAFRKEMMTHHPDMHSNGSEAEKARAVERSKLITDAYRKIKMEMK